MGVSLKVPQEHLEFKYIVNGVGNFNPDYPTEFTNDVMRVNVKHIDPVKRQIDGGALRKIVSKISGLDVYSLFSVAETSSMLLFRV